MASQQMAPTRQEQAGTLQEVLVKGDMSVLTEEQRVKYYAAVCESVRLNPLTKPFEYLLIKGKGQEKDKLILYANKNCAEQLRSLHKVSVKVVSREKIYGLFLVTVQATTPDGRTDESIGAVPIEKEGGEWRDKRGGGREFKADGTVIPIVGEALANCMLKAETKAKRRVTLSICGLGMADESELESLLGTPSLAHPQIDGAGAGASPRAIAHVPQPAASAGDPTKITAAQWEEIKTACDFAGWTPLGLCKWVGVQRGSEIRKEDFAAVLALAKMPAEEREGTSSSEWDKAASPGISGAPKLATAQQVEQLEREFARTGYSGDRLAELLKGNHVSSVAELLESKAAWLIGEFANVPDAAVAAHLDKDIPF